MRSAGHVARTEERKVGKGVYRVLAGRSESGERKNLNGLRFLAVYIYIYIISL
jgi:hypothetical protein